MSFPRYSKYRDSDISWIGEIPEHWQSLRLANVFEVQSRPVRDSDEIVTAFRDGEVTLRSKRREEGFTNAVKEIGYQGIRAGDLIIHAMDAFAGAIGVSDSDGKSTPVYSVCTPIHPKTLTRHYGFLLRYMALSGYINSLAKGIRERSTDFRWTDARTVIVPIPSYEEQIAVVGFLDQETAKIDALIEEQRRLIELLKEKRQAVISHAVTKGLDPEWEWEAGPLKRYFTNLDGRRIPLSVEERSHKQGEYPYYGASGIIDSVDEYLFDEPLVLVSEDGANLLNRSTPIAFVAHGRYWVNNHAHILRPDDGSVEFWAERIEAIDLSPYVTGSAQPKFTSEALGNLLVSAPKYVEARAAIEEYIRRERSQFDELMSEAADAIRLLQERRSALISAAVTGKIDVRNYKPQSPAPAEELYEPA